MRAAGRLRQRLQWPRPVLAAIDILAVLLSLSAAVAIFAALEAETDTPFVVAQVLSAAAMLVDSLALMLSLVRIRRTGLDLAVVVVSSALLLATILLTWALCWAAGLGGERCWWETLDL